MKVLNLGQKMFYLGISELEFQEAIVIIEVSAL